ncbi:hypothetical protein QQX98_000599 [Neonectria punicea]|uniref:Uncharacterized protein n=1 Tax=Neonectria punicea TaxID=979145 RepID=A0ABR1HTD2_9HYPO
MQFKPLAIATGILAVSSVHAQVNVTDIISDISDIAVLASEVKIIDNIGQIVEIITTDVEEIGASNVTVKATDQTDVCDGFQEFLEAVGQIADTVTENIDILSDTPFSGAIADVISSVKDGINDFSDQILDVVPDCGSDTENSLESVNTSFSTCLEKLA